MAFPRHWQPHFFSRLTFGVSHYLIIFALTTACTASPTPPPAAQRIVTTPLITQPVTQPSTIPATQPPAADVRSSASPAANDPTPQPPQSPTPIPQITLMAVGDLMLARTIGERVYSQGPQSIFAGVQPILDSADLLVGNLECAITDRGQPEPGKGYTFAAPPAAADALAAAGFDVLSLANNHALDYGFEGLAQTQSLLDERGIAFVGAGENEVAAHRPLIVERNGLRLAFLAYVDVLVEDGGFDTRRWVASAASPGMAWAYPDRIREDAAAARAESEVVIVLLHFGYEGRTGPVASQQQAARAAIEGGAALVLGSHPHVLQRTERYQNGLIVYSLGNFVFDGFGFPANYSAIFSATIDGSGVRDYGWFPVVVVDDGLPRLATAEETPMILALVGE